MKFLIILQKLKTCLKLKSSFVVKQYHWLFFQSYMMKIGMIEKQDNGWKRDSKWYFRNSYFFPITQIHHKLLLQTLIISPARILSGLLPMKAATPSPMQYCRIWSNGKMLDVVCTNYWYNSSASLCDKYKLQLFTSKDVGGTNDVKLYHEQAGSCTVWYILSNSDGITW